MGKVDEQLRKGVTALQSGDVALAERCFRKAVDTAPTHFGALNLLAVALNGVQRFEEAEKVARRALQIDASSDSTHYNYATILKQNGKLDEAVAAFDRALAINPTHFKALNNRGAALSQLQRHEEASADFDRAIALNGRFGEAYFNKANALVALGRREEALRAFERALALNPRHAGAYANLVDLFREFGHHGKAEDCGRRALAIDANCAEAYVNLATLEQDRGQFLAALGWLDSLLARQPDNLVGLCRRVSILVGLGRAEAARKDFDRAKRLKARDSAQRAEVETAGASVMSAEGEYDEALAAYDRAIAESGARREHLMGMRAAAKQAFGRSEAALQDYDRILELNPSAAAAWFGRSDLVKFAPDDPSIAAMAAVLERGTALTYGERVQLNFALGKAYLDFDDSPSAFRHLNAGNRMKRAVMAYDAERPRAFFAEIAEIFNVDLLMRLGDRGARSTAPVFVVGMPRSGTTLIEQILSAHPAVHGAGELLYMRDVAARLGEFPKSVTTFDASGLTRLGEDYLSRVFALRGGKLRLVDKMPENFIYAGLIRLILPDAKIIHSRRDAVDTCFSCYTKLFEQALDFSYDLIDLGRYYRAYMGDLDGALAGGSAGVAFS